MRAPALPPSGSVDARRLPALRIVDEVSKKRRERLAFSREMSSGQRGPRASAIVGALLAQISERARGIRLSYARAARHLGCIAESSGGGGISSALGSCICFGSYSVSIGEHASTSTRHVHCARAGALKSGGGGGGCGHGVRTGKTG